MSDNRIRFVLARYDKPFIPIPGSTNSIDSALKAAQKLKWKMMNHKISLNLIYISSMIYFNK